MVDRHRAIQALQTMDAVSGEMHKEFARQIYEMTWRGEYDLALEKIHAFLSHPSPGFKEARWFFVAAKTIVLSRAGRLDECIKYAETELENLPMDQFHIPNISGAYCSLMNTIGSCLTRKGRLNDAMDRFKTVIKVAEKYDHRDELAGAFANSGALLLKSRPLEALSLLKKAEPLTVDSDKQQLRAAIFGFMGECRLALEDYDEAEFFLMQELRIARQIGSPSEIKHASSHLNDLYDKMNLDGLSKKFQDEAMGLAEQESSFDRLWSLEQRIQGMRRDRGNAQAYYLETTNAKKEAIKEKNPYFVATFCSYNAEALYLLSQEYDHEQNLQHAKQELKQAIRIFRRENYKRNMANALKFLGSWERRVGHHEYCVTPIDQSVELYETLHDYESLSDAYTELGLAHRSLGNRCEAMEFFERAIQIFERNYRKIRSLGLKTLFFGGQRQSPHQHLLSLYLDAGMWEQAWLTVQKIRGRSLFIMLSLSSVELGKEDFENPGLSEAYQGLRALENEQNILWEKWQRQEMMDQKDASQATLDLYTQGERQCQELFSRLEKEPRFNFFRTQTPVSYGELRDLLAD